MIQRYAVSSWIFRNSQNFNTFTCIPLAALKMSRRYSSSIHTLLNIAISFEQPYLSVYEVWQNRRHDPWHTYTNKNSHEVISGELSGQTINPSQQLKLPGKFLFNRPIKSKEQFAGAPFCCMSSIIFTCHPFPTLAHIIAKSKFKLHRKCHYSSQRVETSRKTMNFKLMSAVYGHFY